MDMHEYQEAAMATAGEPPDSLVFGSLALCGEAGELANYVKKVRWHEHEFDTAKVVEELGDMLWYIAYISTKLGVSLSLVATDNLTKLEKRYPEGFDPERSKNRDGL
jgi:NTP pyrophosphatase (non-canonical NTP hydrolase)